MSCADKYQFCFIVIPLYYYCINFYGLYDGNPLIISSGEYFVGGETGMAIHGTVCTAKSVGISVDVNAYEPHIIAGSMAHMIGHNVGMGHDDKSK